MEIGPPICDRNSVSCIIIIVVTIIYCISYYISDIVLSAFHVFI